MPAKKSKPTFDVIIEQTQDIVKKLESGDLSLEESLKTYETGVTLIKEGHRLLQNIEEKIELLTQESNQEQPISLNIQDNEPEHIE